jgi:hypothetical protein
MPGYSLIKTRGAFTDTIIIADMIVGTFTSTTACASIGIAALACWANGLCLADAPALIAPVAGAGKAIIAVCIGIAFPPSCASLNGRALARVALTSIVTGASIAIITWRVISSCTPAVAAARNGLDAEMPGRIAHAIIAEVAFGADIGIVTDSIV